MRTDKDNKRTEKVVSNENERERKEINGNPHHIKPNQIKSNQKAGDGSRILHFSASLILRCSVRFFVPPSPETWSVFTSSCILGGWECQHQRRFSIFDFGFDFGLNLDFNFDCGCRLCREEQKPVRRTAA